MSGNSDTNIEVGISVETGGIAQGMQQATHEVESGSEAMKAALEHATEAAKTFMELLGVGVSVEWMKGVVEHATEAAEAANNMSQSLGVSTQMIQTMGFAAALTGGNMETATAAIARLEKAAVAAASGSIQQAEAFRAIGVSVKDASGHIKDTEQLINETTKALSGFENGATKTAVAMELMGRGAARNMAFINEYGKHQEELAQQAKELGIALSDTAQHAMLEFQERSNLLGQQVKGLANQFVIEFLPVLKLVQDGFAALLNSGIAQNAFHAVATQIEEVIVIGKQVIGVLADAYNYVKQFLASFGIKIQFPVFTDIADGLKSVANLFVLFSASALQVWADLSYWGQRAWLSIKQIAVDTVNASVQALGSLSESLAKFANYTGAFLMGAALNEAAGYFKTVKVAATDYKDALTQLDAKHNATTDDIAAGLAKGRQAIAGWTDGVHHSVEEMNHLHDAVHAGGKALDDYNAHMKDTSGEAQKLAELMNKWGEQMDLLAAKTAGPYDAAWLKYSATMEKLDGEIFKMLGLGLSLKDAIEMLARASDLATDAANREVEAFYRKADVLDTLYQKYQNADAAASALTNAQKAQVEVDQAIKKELDELIAKYGEESDTVKAVRDDLLGNRDATIKGIAAFKDHEQAVKADVEAMKQWVDIAKNAMDSAFQTINKDIVEGGNVMKDLANTAKTVVEQILMQFERLLIINPLLNSIFGANASPNGLLPTGLGSLGHLFGGGGGAGGSGGGLLGMFGQGGMFGGMGDAVGGVGFKALDFLSSDGSLGGALGTIGGAFGGFQLGQALGLGTGGSLALGAGVGALSYFVPVVGWIMGAASLLNTITGGGLFGTQWKPTGQSSSDISLGASGGSVQDFVQESKKKAFFGGRSWKDVSVAAPQDQVDAVNQMFASLKKSVQAGANALGVEMPELIGGSFKQVFDKNGKVTSELSTVLGQTYKETVQQFAERVTAENLIALLPAAQHASDIAKQWRSSADLLMQGTQLLVQAQVDINHGMGLLGSDGSLADIVKEVQDLQKQGETLAQTYVRLHVEVSDFKAVIGDLGLATDKTGADLVKFADDLATAAGGLKNLDTLWSDYYTNYFSQSEQQANNLKHLQDAVTTTFAAIGEDPKESMAKFREDFEKAFPTLTPEQIVEWLQAGDALAKFNKYIEQTKQAASGTTDDKALKAYQDYVKKFDPATLGLTSFESGLLKLGDTLQNNIDQANALAKAAGMSGASMKDIANIMEASAQAGVAALKQFEAQAQQLAVSLYGTSVQQLQTELAQLKADQAASAQLPGMDAYYQSKIDAKQKEIDAATAAAEHAKRLTDATTLLGDLSQIGAVTGESLSQLADKMAIPLDKLAGDLGLTKAQLESQFTQQESAALAAIQSRDYLQEILNVLQGKPALFDPGAATHHSRGGNQVTIAANDPGDTGVHQLHRAVASGTQQSASDMQTNNRLLHEQNDLLRQIIRGGSIQPIMRNSRIPVMNP